MLAAGAILGPVEAAPAADAQRQVLPAADTQKQVLVLYSTRRDAQIAVLGDHVLPKLFDEGLTQSVDYYSEHIDVARFPDATYRAAFTDFLRLKYGGHQFDLIIAMHEIAIEFVEDARRELFSDTPIVFFATSPSVRRIPNSTGLIGDLNLQGTVALAAELQPDLRQVFVVSGAEIVDKQYERQARAQLQSFESQLTFIYLSGLPTRELESRLASLPGHSIVYFLLVSRDGAGQNFHPLEYVDRVTSVANAPTYCWVDSAMDHGIVGGRLKKQEAEIEALAKLGLRVLHGESADSIPVSSPDLSVQQVDWRQLRRWGISEARVPAGTLIRFREPSAWDSHRSYILTAAGLLLAQAALIAGLLIQRVRRRQAEMQLHASQAELHSAYARLLGAQESERFRIARELHDDIGQRMAALTMELDFLGQKLPPATTDLRGRIQTLSSRALELANDIQATSRNLHSSKVDYLGLESASAGFCRELSAQQNLEVDFNSYDISGDIPKDVALCVYRVLQEALNNAVKHARARRVTVALRDAGDEIQLDVVDDGIGFDPNATANSPGLGLISMKERLRIVRGEMTIKSRPGAGATIRARVPLARSGGLSADAKV
jgi:signal transduction histidine kinase